MKKIISLTLALLLLLPAFAACGENKENSDAPADAPVDAGTPSAESPAEEETEPDLYRDLPAGDYGGADFALLQYEETSAATSTVCVEELNGEAVNDAIYQRTLNVNERLGVNIVFEKTSLSAVNSIMSTSITAGDDFYQVFGNENVMQVTTIIDNLGKGASGAAIQNMNIALGLDESISLV